MPGYEEEESSPFLGFLAGLGRTLDYPGRKIREFVSGKEDASGRDVLEKLGILGPNTEGFDWGDVPGFAAEIVMDPLTYVGGIGTLTKSGKLVKRGTDLALRLKAATGQARPAAEIAELAAAHSGVLQKLGGRTAPLAGTWAEQAKMGDRAALTFAGVPLQVPGIMPALEGTKNLLGKLPGADLASKLFNPQYGKNQEFRPFVEAFGQGTREAPQRAAAAAEEFGATIFDPATEFVPKNWTDAYETMGKPGAMPFASPEEKIGADMFKAKMEDLGARELGSYGRKQESFIDPNGPINYFPRYATSEAKQGLPGGERAWVAAQGGNPASLRNQLGQDWSLQSAHRSNEMMRDPETAQMLTSAASGIKAEKHGIEGEFFDLDPRRAMYKRVHQGEGMIEIAKFARSTIDNFATEGEGLSVSQFASDMGIHVPAEEMAKYGKMSVPRDIAEEAIKMQRKITQPEEISQLGKLYDKLSGIHQYWLTQPLPAFHIRNLLSGAELTRSS
jgi:hypothetical protein